MTQLKPMKSAAGVPDTAFIEAIEVILLEPMNGGFFSTEVTMPSGEKVIHRFSFASGISNLNARHHYEKHFGKLPPSWTESVHPRHATQSCNLAIEANMELPLVNPLYRYSGDTE